MGWRHTLPTRERLLSHPWIRPLANRLTHPALWQFNRRRVARGAALGLFVGLTVPLGQTPVAAFLALPLRANLIVAAVATLVTNPITFPLIYYAAYRCGIVIIGGETAYPLQEHAEPGWIAQTAIWLAGASFPTAIGLLLFAGAAALLGYAGVHYGWTLRTVRRWRTRQRLLSTRCPKAGRFHSGRP